MNHRETVSSQLRRIRKARGLSLAEVARRADTSPASLSRYEGGWTRFEVYTLEKLASALGCELSIDLKPKPRPRKAPASSVPLRRLGRLFWDAPLTDRLARQYPVWVVERVLDYGNLEDIRALLAFFGRDRFLDTVAHASKLSSRTRTFWQQVLKKEGVPCTTRSFRRTDWNS
jgi:transcriptional regulator with XRE-family HTH domain